MQAGSWRTRSWSAEIVASRSARMTFQTRRLSEASE